MGALSRARKLFQTLGNDIAEFNKGSKSTLIVVQYGWLLELVLLQELDEHVFEATPALARVKIHQWIWMLSCS